MHIRFSAPSLAAASQELRKRSSQELSAAGTARTIREARFYEGRASGLRDAAHFLDSLVIEKEQKIDPGAMNWRLPDVPDSSPELPPSNPEAKP